MKLHGRQNWLGMCQLDGGGLFLPHFSRFPFNRGICLLRLSCTPKAGDKHEKHQKQEPQGTSFKAPIHTPCLLCKARRGGFSAACCCDLRDAPKETSLVAQDLSIRSSCSIRMVLGLTRATYLCNSLVRFLFRVRKWARGFRRQGLDVEV